MLRFENVALTQGDFRLSVDFDIAEGAHVALLGPSGAGKSTLLSAVAGFLMPQAGRILWQEQDLAPLSPGARPMSILFQDNNLFPHLTVFQNVGLGLGADLKLSTQDRTRVLDALERVGLRERAEAYPRALSGGQIARVAIARVLLRARPLMLLDEPFAALGPALKKEMLALVSEVATQVGATLLMISHDPEDAKSIAPQTVLVAAGRALAPQDTMPLLANPPKELAAYLGV